MAKRIRPSDDSENSCTPSDVDLSPRSPLIISSLSGPTSTSQSARSRRASSVKRTTDTRHHNEPIKYHPFDTRDERLPAEAKVWFNKVRTEVSRGRNILPADLKDTFLSDKLADDLCDSCFDSDNARRKLGWVPPLKKAAKVQSRTLKCLAEGHDEAYWAVHVYAYIYDLALRDRSSLLECVECSSARAEPPSILTMSPSGRHSESGMIDAVFRLNLSEAAQQARNELVRHYALDDFYLNHTAYEPLLDLPISVSIKTGQNLQLAKLQAGLWVAAQFKRLEQLVRLHAPATDARALLPPFLPLVIIQGPDWYFLTATRNGVETIIWHNVLIGSTRDISGVYQIITMLQLLAQWSVETYLPWFEKYALGKEREGDA